MQSFPERDILAKRKGVGAKGQRNHTACKSYQQLLYMTNKF
jgi:hypothetical protein